MIRIHFIEIEDQSWCPKVLRDGLTDFLQHIVQTYRLYNQIGPLLFEALQQGRRPFRWSRLVFTYLMSVIPFLVMFDGIVSCLRTYF